MKKFLFTALVLLSALVCAQDTSKSKILSSLENYFYLDRENIHVHFDKTVFFTEEDIWFQGYVFNKKANTPFIETTNVYAVLFDRSGGKIQEQLIYANQGSFLGKFKLGPGVTSGVYFVHFYTNYMNNFTEDESALYELDIVNPENPEITDRRTVNRSQPKIEIFPEGGQLIAGISNNVALKITDCNGELLDVRQASISDASGVISTVAIDATGIGRTYITPGRQPLSVSVEIDGKKHTQVFPPVAASGLAMEVNNYAMPGKTVLKFRASADLLGKDFYCVIQQNDKANIFDVKFNLAEQSFTVDNTDFFPGVSVVRLVTKELEQLAFRHVFRFPPQSEVMLSAGQAGSSAKVNGKVPAATIGSITVLPAQTESHQKGSDIRTAFWLDAYLPTRSKNLSALLSAESKANLYRLDLYMLTQDVEKYKWTSLMGPAPKLTYDFDIGVTITGNVGKSISNPKNHRMCLQSPVAFMVDYTEVDAKGNFTFRNMVFPDESDLLFNLLKNPSTPLNFDLTYQVQNVTRGFRKGFRPPTSCERGKITLKADEIPDFAPGAIALEDVTVVKKKPVLTRQRAYGNTMLRGVKVTDDNNHTDLLTYLGILGFNVTRYQGRVDISSTFDTSLQGGRTRPAVFVDGRQSLSFDELEPIHMQDVDEIYFEKQAIVPTGGNFSGMIKVYLRKQSLYNSKGITKRVHVKDGFALMQSYEAPLYTYVNERAFAQYGVVSWNPDFRARENGEIEVTIENANTPEVMVIFEGFTPDGKLMHQEKKLMLR